MGSACTKGVKSTATVSPAPEPARDPPVRSLKRLDTPGPGYRSKRRGSVSWRRTAAAAGGHSARLPASSHLLRPSGGCDGCPGIFANPFLTQQPAPPCPALKVSAEPSGGRASLPPTRQSIAKLAHSTLKIQELVRSTLLFKGGCWG